MIKYQGKSGKSRTIPSIPGTDNLRCGILLKRYAMNPKNLTPNWTESLRQNPSFDHLKDEQKEGFIDSIRQLASILLALNVNSTVVTMPNESIRTAA